MGLSTYQYCFKTFIKSGAFISTQRNLDFILHRHYQPAPGYEGIQTCKNCIFTLRISFLQNHSKTVFWNTTPSFWNGQALLSLERIMLEWDALIVFKTFREFHDIARRDYPSAIETRSNSCEQRHFRQIIKWLRHVGQYSSLLVTHNTASNLMQILCSQLRLSWSLWNS